MAVVWTLGFAWAGHVRAPVRMLVLEALVTWSVYVADRLLDAKRGLRDPSKQRLRERHFFHWRHRRALLPLAIAAGCAAAGIVAALTAPEARATDSVLGAAALAYFSGVHSARRSLLGQWPRSFPGKEFLVGLLFTAGCALAAWDGTGRLAAWTFWIPAIGFAALAWLNCASIARWESKDASRSPRAFALALAALELVLSMFAAVREPRSAALLAAAGLSALLLALLDRLRTRMTPLELRSAADVVLLTPALMMISSWVLG